MRRAPFVGAATVVGLVGVLSFHTRSLSLATAAPPTAPRPTSRPTPSTTPPTTGPGASAAGGAPSTSTVPSTTTAPAGGATTTATATGTLEQYGYGELRVQVTVTGGRISEVSVPKLLTAEQYSQQLAQQVIPMLRSEVLQAQTANISSVSGATYTSEAYALSLQAALKQLHFA
jgi:uncharacterized protein with FMN-binding domain